MHTGSWSYEAAKWETASMQLHALTEVTNHPSSQDLEHTWHCWSSPCIQLAFLPFCWGTSGGLALWSATVMAIGPIHFRRSSNTGVTIGEAAVQLWHSRYQQGRCLSPRVLSALSTRKPLWSTCLQDAACSGCDLNPKDTLSYWSFNDQHWICSKSKNQKARPAVKQQWERGTVIILRLFSTLYPFRNPL